MRATKAKPTDIRERIETEAAIPASGGVTAQARTMGSVRNDRAYRHEEAAVDAARDSENRDAGVGPDVSLAGLKAAISSSNRRWAVQVLRDRAPVK